MGYGFLMVKPDARNRRIYSAVQDDVLQSCKQNGLSIVGKWTKKLNSREVVRIYPAIFQKSFAHDFITLMTSNRSTLFLLSGFDAINKAKTIRGCQRNRSSEKIVGIRGKYCLIEDVSDGDWIKLKAGRHPDQKRLVAIIIGSIVHAPDSEAEISVALEIFKKTAG